MNVMMVIGIITILLMVIFAFTTREERKYYCRNILAWVINMLSKLKPTKRVVITRTKAIIMKECSICYKTPCTLVETENNNQINVCENCIQEQLSKGLWKENIY